MNPYTASVSGPVVTVKFDDVRGQWEQWLFLRSDAHHDSILCNRELEQRQLELAKARGALILDGGDLFDAMQGKHDKRSSYDELRDEDKVGNYLDSIVTHAAENYGPYASNWLMLAHGNHETGVLAHSNTDITSHLQAALNQAGGNVKCGAFAGWVRFQFQIQETVRQTVALRYGHSGGSNNAPVTKGVIDVNRQAVWLPDADIVWNGHNHQGYLVPVARERLNASGRVVQDLVWYVRTPGYKSRGSWEIQKSMAPGPHGGAWVRFYLNATASAIEYDVMMDLA